MIIHKQGKRNVNVYIGFGQYDYIRSPLCVGAKLIYEGKTYLTHRLWKYVTCKHCLKMKSNSCKENKNE